MHAASPTTVGVQREDIVLEGKGVSVRFGGLQALSDVNMSVERGRVTAVIGPNGAGKSTLLGVLSGFIVPEAGEVFLEGRNVSKGAAWNRVRWGMARTFQDLEVFANLTVAENVSVAVPSKVARHPLGRFIFPGRFRQERLQNRRRVVELLERVGLIEFADRKAKELSYGQQKLLVVARLMATDAALLLFDEPGAGLGRNNIDDLGEILRSLAQDGRTVFFTDHNMHLVFGIADYIYVLHHGALVAEGTPDEIQANERVVSIYLGGANTKGTK